MDWVDRAELFTRLAQRDRFGRIYEPKGQFVEDEMYLFVMVPKG